MGETANIDFPGSVVVVATAAAAATVAVDDDDAAFHGLRLSPTNFRPCPVIPF